MGIHLRLGGDEPGFIIGGIHCRLLHRQQFVPKLPNWSLQGSYRGIIITNDVKCQRKAVSWPGCVLL